jgi:hypothetical protein
VTRAGLKLTPEIEKEIEADLLQALPES